MISLPEEIFCQAPKQVIEFGGIALWLGGTWMVKVRQGSESLCQKPKGGGGSSTGLASRHTIHMLRQGLTSLK